MTLQSDFNKGFHGELPKWTKTKGDDKPKTKKIKNKVYK
tara:strand:- start:1863 stop:1979 length:117 start_codon:yes stop_codon:yes gene_type:complete